ncbi:MAG TPA: hypothetical protein VFW07_28440 [Parafilimonas sp.]|nr:hypothetical protein [Parafilimonas sp.]
MASISSCLEWGDQSVNQCTDWKEQTDRSCNDWDANCCTWWPCSWACSAVTWVCLGWSYVTTFVCVVWTVIVTTVCVLYSLIELILTPIGFLVGVIMSIPVVGRIIDWLLNILAEILNRIINLPEFLGTLLGIKLLKKLKICVIILRDEIGNALISEQTLQSIIDSAKTIYLNQCNVQLQVEGIHTVDKPSPSEALDVGCNTDALSTDVWIGGSYFEFIANWVCPLSISISGRTLRLSPTVIVFIVRTIDGGPPDNTVGCAMWTATDYLTLEPDPRCLAHELGHKCGLFHDPDIRNLMNANGCSNRNLTSFQQAVIRSSLYVSYAF